MDAKTTQTAGVDLSKMTIEQQRELAKTLRATLKEGKADLKGEVTQIKQDEAGIIWLGVRRGSDPGVIASGANAGQPYLFQADGLEFALDGIKYRLGNVYAYAAKTAK